MTFTLQFTNKYGERYFFGNLGAQWPYQPARRMIDQTHEDRTKARTFATAEEAREVLVAAGDPSGWEVVSDAPRP